MDIFIEYLVKQKSNTKIKLQKFLLIFGLIILSFVLFMLSSAFQNIAFIFFLIFAGAIYGTWYLFTSFKVEFEYIITNGEMDVDKIIAQRKRKRLTTLKFRDIEIMAPVCEARRRDFENPNVKTKIDASVSTEEKGAYFIIFNQAKQGLTRLIFTPDERIIKSAQSVAPRKVFTD
jgi:hypothetical protein